VVPPVHVAKGGKRARMTLGTYPATSLARARTIAMEAHGHLDEGRDPRDVAAEQAAKAMTVAELIRELPRKAYQTQSQECG